MLLCCLLCQGQIPRHVSESELRRLFDPYGPIQELVILRDKHTNAHRGCAFLTYHSRQSADAAIEALHEKISLHNRPMVVRYAGPHNQPQETKLFVGMLSRNTGEEAIEQLFSKYGGVKEVYLMRDAMQQSKGCAFVKMANRAEAELAIAELNETHQDTGAPRKLVVRFADSKAGRLSAGGMHGGVSGGAYDRGERGMYGVMINGQQHWPAWSVPAHMQNPYAASLYVAQQAQAQALARQQQSSIRGIYSGPQYYSREQHLHMQHLHQMQQQQQQQQQQAGQQPYEATNTTVNASATSTQLSPPSPFNPHHQHNPFNLASLAASLPTASSPAPSPPRGPPGSNLFVYNIPDSYTDDDLLPLFSPYGGIVSVRVYRDKMTGVSRGFGFVSYGDSAAAERAIQALNGMQINGKRLKVMLKKQGGRGDNRGGEAAMPGGGGNAGGGFDMYAPNNGAPGGRGYGSY